MIIFELLKIAAYVVKLWKHVGIVIEIEMY